MPALPPDPDGHHARLRDALFEVRALIVRHHAPDPRVVRLAEGLLECADMIWPRPWSMAEKEGKR